MKQTIKLLFCLICLTLFFAVSCKSTSSKSQTINESVDSKNNLITESNQIIEPKQLEKNIHSDEFNRSTTNLKNEISEDTFQEDKKAILEIIKELNIIMAKKDYESWTKYLTKSSITYWSNPSNLAMISKKLPISGYTLTSLEDYFKLIFIPARLGREVTEIRYLSKDYVRAVQVREDSDAIFYSFKKIDGKWFLKLET
ncbi:MAG: hypothetical protein BKP49_01590 [Treponema sp. CETP13]|nr:MAG: hypothetical protein BKP49_01590 [Treponema sp. CETP13]